MVTQELIAYIRSELNKGRSREQIRTTLLSGGGWSDMDISEVFRDIMPLGSGGVILPEKTKQVLKPDPVPQPELPPPVVKIAPTPIAKIENKEKDNKSVFHVVNNQKKPHVHMLCSLKIEKNILFSKRIGYVLWVILFSLIIFLGYLLRENFSILGMKSASVLDTLINKVNTPEDEMAILPEVPNSPVLPKTEEVVEVINCGVTTAPDVKGQLIYLKDPVLKCIGENANTCTRTTAILSSEFFPTNLEIKKQGDICSVEIMYARSSSLMDVFNKPLASRFISCPISVVKHLDTTKQNISFIDARKDNLNQYGFDIHFYTTLGLFIDNNFDNAKIEASGCRGDYIQSVIESHNLQN